MQPLRCSPLRRSPPETGWRVNPGWYVLALTMFGVGFFLGMLLYRAAGWDGPWLERMGLHRCATTRILLDLGDRFILDGEAFPAGSYEITPGPALSFVVP